MKNHVSKRMKIIYSYPQITSSASPTNAKLYSVTIKHDEVQGEVLVSNTNEMRMKYFL